MIGTKLAHYEITSHVGSGGMGDVYQATDTKLGRSVAIKFLPEAFSHDADRIARFQREARVLASLNHPGIAAIYGVEEINRRHFLVMELVPGETLAERIRRGAIPIEEALPIAKQLAEALEEAHEKGLIHRDLKPANIKITPEGSVKVLDFGLACVNEPAPGLAPSDGFSDSPTVMSMAATQQGLILGTASYMSPEQAKGKKVDTRTDIFSFGCVLYEMLTGRKAFEGEDLSQIFARVLEREPQWNLLPPAAAVRVQRLLRLCLEKDPKKRRQSAGDVRIDIEQALNEPVSGAQVQAVESKRRVWVPWAVAGLFAVALIGAVGIAFRPVPAVPEMRVQIVTPATDLPAHFALSPDGRRIAFIAGGGGPERLWLRPLDKAEAQPILGTEGAQLPFWSPDSRSLGFFASGKLYRVDIASGPPQALADAPFGRGGTWNRDGVIVFAGFGGVGLMRVAASGGELFPVTKLDPKSTSHRLPQFLPDGRRFLFYAVGSPGGIYLGTLDGGEPKRLTANDTAGMYLPPGRLLFVRQGTLMTQPLDLARGELTGEPETLADLAVVEPGFNKAALSVSDDGRVVYRTANAQQGRQLKWYDRTGKAVGVAGEPDLNGPEHPALSPDDRRVALDRVVQGNWDIYLMDIERTGMTRFTFDAAVERSPIWSPDGTRIVFRSQRKGPGDLYTKPSNGSGMEELLLETPNTTTAQDWSKDGRFLLYSEVDSKTGDDLKALPLTGNERKPVVVVNTTFTEGQGQFSPDGHWVAYTTNESGRYEIVVQPFPEPTGKWQVSTGGGVQPRWRADGRELYFIAPDQKLMAASITAGTATFAASTPVALFQARIHEGAATASVPQYAVSRDGRFLILETGGEAVLSPITLLLNWRPK